jgi:hypothetical protein
MILLIQCKFKSLIWIYGWPRWVTRWQRAQFRGVGRLPWNRTWVSSSGFWQPRAPIRQLFSLDLGPNPKWRSGTIANTTLTMHMHIRPNSGFSAVTDDIIGIYQISIARPGHKRAPKIDYFAYRTLWNTIINQILIGCKSSEFAKIRCSRMPNLAKTQAVWDDVQVWNCLLLTGSSPWSFHN